MRRSFQRQGLDLKIEEQEDGWDLLSINGHTVQAKISNGSLLVKHPWCKTAFFPFGKRNSDYAKRLCAYVTSFASKALLRQLREDRAQSELAREKAERERRRRDLHFTIGKASGFVAGFECKTMGTKDADVTLRVPLGKMDDLIEFIRTLNTAPKPSP